MIMTVVIGTSLGVFSGYVGGKVDMFLMSFTDIFLALPSMLLMVILNTFLKPGLPTLIVVDVYKRQAFGRPDRRLRRKQSAGAGKKCAG